MRHLMPQSAIFLALFATQIPSQAATGPWSGSYAADGACYCTGNLSEEMQQFKVSTPQGEKSLLQVCALVGAGPQLVRSADGYNYPVYADSQCGRGPFADDEPLADAACAGSMNPGSGDCQGIGPAWKFRAAPEAKKIERQVASAANENDGASDYIKPSSAGADHSEISTNTVSEGATDVSRPHYIKVPQATTNTTASNAVIEDSSPLDSSIPQATAKANIETRPAETQAERDARMQAMIERARQRLNGVEQSELPAVTSIDIETTNDSNPVAQQETSTSVLIEPTEEAVAVEVADKEENVSETTTTIAQSGDVEESESSLVALSNALRLPATVRQSGREFNYVAGSPVGYDYGGAGVQVEASNSQLNRVRLHAQVGLAQEYKEVQLGAGLYHTPAAADRITLMVSAGVEYGTFDLQDGTVSTSLSDSGLFLQAGSRIVLNNKFELNTGVGYSGFFEGDAFFYGAGFYHINSKLDAMSRFKVGDNDTFGIGIRYFY